MLEYARQKAEQQGVTNIQFHHAGFLTYEHQGKPLDAVVSQLALHHLPDFWKMIALQRIFEMLESGGKFYLMDTLYSFEPVDHVSFFVTIQPSLNQFPLLKPKNQYTMTSLLIYIQNKPNFSIDLRGLIWNVKRFLQFMKLVLKQ
jgi:ubiquinone/menaquinone biosynthesis C-methylase UbiE